MIEMNFKDWIHLVLVMSQILIWLRVKKEGSECGWSRQAKWIGYRITCVMTGIGLLTLISWFYLQSVDILLDWLLVVGLMAMTLIIVYHLPSILNAMTDEKIGEDLNICMNDLES